MFFCSSCAAREFGGRPDRLISLSSHVMSGAEGQLFVVLRKQIDARQVLHAMGTVEL